VNKLGAELIFKGGDLFADGGLANPAFLCDTEKLPFSMIRTNICIASNLSTTASGCLLGMNSMRVVAIFLVLSSTLILSSSPCIPVGNGWYSQYCQIRLQQWDIRYGVCNPNKIAAS
jgi:hypothetical protein